MAPGAPDTVGSPRDAENIALTLFLLRCFDLECIFRELILFPRCAPEESRNPTSIQTSGALSGLSVLDRSSEFSNSLTCPKLRYDMVE